MPMDRAGPMPQWELFGAVLFDLDGVLTPTAEVHFRAWRAMFDEFFDRSEPPLRKFSSADYHEYVDGRPRLNGVRAVLESRGITLPLGGDDDTLEDWSQRGLGNRKQELFREILHREGITPFPGSVRLLDHLAKLGVPCAVVTASRNARTVLAAAGLEGRCDVIVDGDAALTRGLAGKPAADTFLEAARLLGVPPGQAVVIEDALAGVAAAASGKFACIVGVDRGAGRGALIAHGAHVVVTDLAETLEGADP